MIFQHAVDAVSAGVSPIGDTSYNSSYWDMGSAFFFAGTVITTIGKRKDVLVSQWLLFKCVCSFPMPPPVVERCKCFQRFLVLVRVQPNPSPSPGMLLNDANLRPSGRWYDKVNTEEVLTGKTPPLFMSYLESTDIFLRRKLFELILYILWQPSNNRPNSN